MSHLFKCLSKRGVRKGLVWKELKAIIFLYTVSILISSQSHMYILSTITSKIFTGDCFVVFLFIWKKYQLLIFIHHHPPPHYTVSSFSFLFLPGVSYVAKDELELFSLLSLPLKCWGYNHALCTPLCCVSIPSAPCMKCKYCTTNLDSHSLVLNRSLT